MLIPFLLVVCFHLLQVRASRVVGLCILVILAKALRLLVHGLIEIWKMNVAKPLAPVVMEGIIRIIGVPLPGKSGKAPLGKLLYHIIQLEKLSLK